MPSVKISNATQNAIKLNYAIIEKNGEKSFRKVLSIEIAPRALLQVVNFANEDYYNAFVKQNEDFIASGKIIISNSVSESKLENASNDIAEADRKSARKKKDAAVETLENSVNNKKTKLKISVDKV